MATDKELIRERFGANFGRYNRLALVQQKICAELARLVQQYRVCGCGDSDGGVKRVLEIGAGTGFLTSRLVPLAPVAQWFVNDLVPDAGKYLAKYLTDNDVEYLWGDAEQIEFPAGVDVIASASTVQWFDDMVGFLRKASQATADGGWLVLSTFGSDNFKEIRATTGEGLDYLPLDELKRMTEESGYEIVYACEYIETLCFDTPTDVLHHIKATGVNSIRKTRWNRGQLADFDSAYRRQFPAADGGVQLTYHPIIILARKVNR